MPYSTDLPFTLSGPPLQFLFAVTWPNWLLADFHLSSVSFFSPFGPMSRGSHQSLQSQPKLSPPSLTTRYNSFAPVMSASMSIEWPAVRGSISLPAKTGLGLGV